MLKTRFCTKLKFNIKRKQFYSFISFMTTRKTLAFPQRAVQRLLLRSLRRKRFVERAAGYRPEEIPEPRGNRNPEKPEAPQLSPVFRASPSDRFAPVLLRSGKEPLELARDEEEHEPEHAQ